ncbi:hypothetical protein EYZ11_010976 [Aspergillus tanneri]|uniref:O-methyltransferase C-terminal domain-containing protein n=1 Tax=Aspergillus tanneri TaxID=1220188 RepID=A0A4S3J4L5_9EURO|nr:hypothetical protein EYZ11_010976 [Aspergillus tanneri]
MASIESLTLTITKQAFKLSSLLHEQGLAAPTLDEASYGDFATEADTPTGKALREARSGILDAAQDLCRLVRGQTEQVLTLAWSVADTAHLDLITRLKLPQKVPLGSSISISELSMATRVSESLLARVLRYSIANGIFVEESPNIICHSATSAALARTPHLVNIVHFGTEFLGGILMKTHEYVVQKRDDPENAAHAAFNIAYQTDQPLFDYFQGNADLTKKYHEYLAGRVNTPLWSSLAPLMPSATFIVQDSNLSALEMGRHAVADSKDDSSLLSRTTFMKHDFFTPQPVHNADIYIFRHILHDWNDADSVRILSALLPALKRGARVLISEGILPAPPAQRLNTLARKMIRIEDMFMLAAHNAHERSVADLESIFEQVKPGGFHLAGVTSGTEAGAFQSLLEFEFLG